MIPFENTVPYDIIMGDMYIPECPFCHTDNVLVSLQPKELPDIRDGKKRLLIMPCCHNRIVVLDADRDYLLADRKIR